MAQPAVQGQQTTQLPRGEPATLIPMGKKDGVKGAKLDRPLCDLLGVYKKRGKESWEWSTASRFPRRSLCRDLG